MDKLLGRSGLAWGQEPLKLGAMDHDAAAWLDGLELADFDPVADRSDVAARDRSDLFQEHERIVYPGRSWEELELGALGLVTALHGLHPFLTSFAHEDPGHSSARRRRW